MRLRRSLAVPFALFVLLAVSTATAAAASPSGVLFTQLRQRTASSPYDQYFQITNPTSATVDLSGWTLDDCYESSGTPKVGTEVTVPTGTTLPAGQSFVFGKDDGDYTGTADLTYPYLVDPTGGVELLSADGTVQDSVGASGTACAQGTGLTFPTSGGDFTFTRKLVDGTYQNTGDNAADFSGPSGDADGTPCGSPCAPPTSPTPIDQVTGTGDISPLVGDTVQIAGIVIGVDNQEDISDYVNLEPDEAGIYVETPTADQDDNPETSEGIFVGDLPAADRTASRIGQTVTVTGVVKDLYGLKEIDPVGAPTFTGQSSNGDLPAPVVIDPAQAAAQTVVQTSTYGVDDVGQRSYYETLQGMRVKLVEGVANSGGTDKFGELYLDPGTATGLNLAGYDTPLGPPDLLDVTQDAGSADVDPSNPDAEPPSSTRVNANLHDHVLGVVGPLGFDYDNYDLVPQPGTPPKVIHDGVQYPPTPPQPEAGTIRIANFNMENLFGAGMTDDGHTYTTAEVDQKTTRLANAIELMNEPDIIADEEVASRAAYQEVARKLGDYRAIWRPSNDERHIAVGFLVKDGIQVTDIQQLGVHATTSITGCNDNPADDPQLFERPPLEITIQTGGLTVTLIGNHWASQGHPEACREAQADFVNAKVRTLEAAGVHVIVIGDLNAYQDSPSLQSDLIAGTSLQDLWFRAPDDDRYSFQYDGQLETLDHIFVDNYLSPLVQKIRYVHFDNDYAGVTDPDSPIEVSDHDPPVAVLKVPR